MKFRLILDNHAALSFPWYRIEKDEGPMGWGYIDSGDETTMRRKFEAIKANPDRYITVDEFDSEAQNSGSKTPTPLGDIPDECTSKGSGGDPA